MRFPFDGSSSVSAPPAAVGSAHDSQDANSHSLKEMWAAAYRSRYWIIAIFGVCIALAILVALLLTRLYTAEASVEVRQEAQKVLGTEADQESRMNGAEAERFMQTQLDIVSSRGVAENVAQTLGLFRGDGFLESMGVDPEDNEPALGLSPREAHQQRVLETLMDAMSVRFTGNTRILVIQFTSPDPRLSAKLVNAYAKAYIRSNLERKADSSVYALDFLRNQLAEAQGRLEKSEQAVVDYARRTRIVDAGNAAGASNATDMQPKSLTTAQLVQLNQAYSQAKIDRIASQQKWEKIADIAPLKTPEVQNNNAVQRLFERRANLQSDYEQQLVTRQSNYPTVVALKSQIAALDKQISVLANEIRAGIKNEYRIALAQEQQLSSQIETLKSETIEEQNRGIQLSILRREADTNRQQYEALLRRYNAVNAESGVQTNNLSIVDLAETPDKPSWPKLSLNIALALVMAGVLSGLFIFLREQLFYTVRTPDDVRRVTGLPLLGVVPSSETPVEDLSQPRSVQSDAYSSVRTSLSLLSPNGLPSTIMVTSTEQGEGKSTACHALALSLARLGRRVLVIDIDLRRPNMHRLFKVANKDGLSNVLTQQITMEQAIRSSGVENIDLVLAGDIPPNPAELISSPQVPALLSNLKTQYDVILFDSAPVLGLADAVVLSHEVENTLYVVESGRNRPRALQTALSRLSQGGTVAGVILVRFDPSRFGYGEGAEYGYSYEYTSRDD